MAPKSPKALFLIKHLFSEWAVSPTEPWQFPGEHLRDRQSLHRLPLVCVLLSWHGVRLWPLYTPGACHRYRHFSKYNHVTGVYLSSQSAPEKKKRDHTLYLCAPHEFVKHMCPPCLITVKPCYFDYRINKPFICSHCLICIRVDVLCAQRITGLQCSTSIAAYTYSNHSNPSSSCATNLQGTHWLVSRSQQHTIFQMKLPVPPAVPRDYDCFPGDVVSLLSSLSE